MHINPLAPRKNILEETVANQPERVEEGLKAHVMVDDGSMHYVEFLRCRKCGAKHALDKARCTCDKCGGPLDVSYKYESIKARFSRKILEQRKGGVWKYRELLPILDENRIISLGEGNTPLLRCNHLAKAIGVENLYVKNECANPTGSFKDRPITVAISRALELGAQTVATVSSGNAGAALSAYAAKAGLKCYVFVHAKAPLGKLTQIMMYGANVIQVDVTSVDEAIPILNWAYKEYGWHHLSNVTPVNPYALEGSKTIAYEICEQMDWKKPDWVVCPVSSGSILAATFKGFMEFRDIGLVNDIPSIVGIQPSGCCPFVKAIKEKRDPRNIEPWKGEARTVAGGILLRDTVDGELAAKAVYETSGLAEAVTDDAILQAERILAASEGIFGEPSGVATVAGLKKLVDTGQIDPDDVIVCEVTGSGFKDLHTASSLCPEPRRISLDVSELRKILDL